ncbi:immunoglobulin-like domain-containing protein [Poseidonibacter lekithochrous]|uniref:immunoglobulin-like domain-containing protein n=1 Tax=Poseidonibacter lekithochrous TaxID=1904463 RepID=UPI0008FCBA38|nr:immunoglobulin-like domain-containing protein [Poseidonibacter lekithochrous]
MAEATGEVREINGEIEIVDANGNSIPLQEGQEIQVGNQVQASVQVVDGQVQIVDNGGNIVELSAGQTLELSDDLPASESPLIQNTQNNNATVNVNNVQDVVINNQNPIILDSTVTQNNTNAFQENAIDNNTLDSLENELVDETNLVADTNNENNVEDNEDEEEIQSDDSTARELDRNGEIADVIADLREPVVDVREQEENILGEELLFVEARLSISGAPIVIEGNETVYTLSLTEVPATDVVVTLSYSGVAIDGTDYTSEQEVTIPAGSKETTFTLPTIDDYFSDNNEPYTIVITDANGGSFDSLIIDPKADRVTTTIIDDSQPDTPNDDTDLIEPTLDSVTLKLIPTDINGNEIPPATINEGETAYYKVIMLDPNGNEISASGNVDITFTDGTAVRTGTSGDAELDFSANNATVALNTVFQAVALDDYISDNNETFNVQITDDTYSNASFYENVIHNTTPVVTTIKDDTGTPNTPNDGPEPTHESVILKLVALNSDGTPVLDGSGNYTFANDVNEGNDAKYMVLAFAPNETTFSPSTKLDNQVGNVDITFADNTASGASSQSKNDGSEDYDNDAQGNVTLGTVISTSTYDDYLSDNNENFTVRITDNTYAPTSGGYENVTIDTNPVTTTIKDDTGTPNTPNDGPEPTHESVILKLVALNSDGTPVLDGSGNYTFANDVNEGNDAKYMVLAFAPNETTFSPSTKLDNQVGNVDITFADNTASGASSQSKNDGSEDYDNDAQGNVTLGTVISTSTYDDYLSDNNENFTVRITDNTYAPTSGGYENVTIDTNPVTTTIKDDANDKVPNEPIDTIYVQLSGDDVKEEANAATLTHNIKLVDKDGNAVNLANGETINITLSYTNDGTVNADFTSKKTTVTITGNGGSDYTFTNIITDDSLKEGTETYDVKIASIDSHSDYFENVKIADTTNGANATVNSAKGTINEEIDLNDENETVVEGATAITSVTQSMNLLDNDELGINGKISSFTYTDESDVVQTATLTGIPGSKTATVDSKYGNITVNEDGTWSFTPDATENNKNGVDDVFTYTVTDDNGANGTANFTVSVTDTNPSASAPDSSVDEDDLASGSDTSKESTVVTQTLNITKNKDDISDVSFDASTKTALEALALKSNNVLITYTLSNSNHTITAKAGADTIFTIDLQNTSDISGATQAYRFELLGSIDHVSGNAENSLNLPFSFNVSDIDSTVAGTTFNVSVVDDIPTANSEAKLSVVEGNVALTGMINLLDNDVQGADDPISTVTSFTYTNESNSSQTVNLSGGSVTVDTKYGSLTVNTNGTWSYISDASESNESGTDNVNTDDKVIDSFTYVITDADGDTSSAAQEIDVTDGANPMINPADLTVSELTLGYGVSLVPFTSQNNLLNISKGSDEIADTKFAVSTITALDALGIESAGESLVYTLSSDGHTITANKTTSSGAEVFKITITNPASTSAKYDFELSLPIDHTKNANPSLDHDTEWTLPITVYTEDTDNKNGVDGDDDAIDTFNIIVQDSTPSSTPSSIVMNEDSGSKTIRISQDAFDSVKITPLNGVQVTVASGNSTNIYDKNGDDIIGSLTNNGDGTLTFTPVTNYSNYTTDLPTFDYEIVDDDGDTSSSTITVEVNPIADAPSVSASNVTTTEDSNNTSEGTNSVALSLTKPSLSLDQTDKNDVTGSASGDKPERLGYIELEFTNGDFVIGAVLEKGDGTDLVTISSSNQIVKVYITDDANFHYSGLDPVSDGAIQLTTAEYQALKIIHAEDNDRDINITVSTTSYEVKDDGTPISTSDNNLKETSSDSMRVIITAKTDDISLAWDNNSRGTISTNINTNDTYTFNTISEDNADRTIDLKSLLTKTSGYETDLKGDLDGSETRTYKITGVPEGTVLSITTIVVTGINPTTTATQVDEYIADSSGTVSMTYTSRLNDDDIKLTLPENFGGNISNAKIELIAKDYDTETESADVAKSAEVYFNINITPVADDVTAAIKQSFGNEDAGRKSDGSTDVSSAASGIDLDVTITTDDKDGSETYTIVLSEIPDGAEIYYDGNLITKTSASVNAQITATNDAGANWSLEIKEFDNSKAFKIIPPYNSNDDINLKVAANAVDGTDIGASVTNLDLNVKVAGVADVMTHNSLNSETIDDTNNMTKTYNKIVKEDTSQVTLETLFTANTPGFTSADITGGDGSESGFVIITDVPSGFDISGALALGGSGTSREWLVEIADFSNVKLDIPANYSGEVDLTLKLQSIENDGNKSSFTNVPLKILVTPETDGTVSGSASQNEDETATLTFTFNKNSDSNESLTLLEINTDSLSLAGVQLFKNGVNITSTGWVSVDVNSDTITAKTPADLDTDYSFDYRYKNSDTTNDGSDFTDHTQNDNTYDDESSNANYVNGTYNVTVNAKTDTATLVLNTIVDADSDANNDISYDSGSKTVTVTDNTIFEVPFTLTSDDMSSEGSNGKDLDGSEKILATVELSGVPEGIDVVGGVYLGDKFDNAGNAINSGRWRVEISNDLVMNSSSGENNSIKFAVGKGSYSDINAAITFTVSHQDTNAEVLTNSETFNLVIDGSDFAGTQPDPSTPPVDLNVTLNSTNFVEDEAKSLNNFFNVSDADANPANNTGKYAITITNLEGGTISGMEFIDSEFYSLTGTGDINDIIASLSSISITPNANENINTPTNVKFDVAITTYGVDEHNTYSFNDVTTEIAPVTDATSIDIAGSTTINEDSSEIFTISLANTADGNRTTIIDGKVYLQLSDTVSTDGGNNGTFELVGGTLPSLTSISANSISDEQGNSLPAGNYYVITGVNLSDNIQVKYTPPSNEYGNTVSIKTYTITKEDPASSGYTTQTLLSSTSKTANVEGVNDGITPFSPTAVGDEDTTVFLNFGGASLVDSSESITFATLSGVPFGFDVYFKGVKQTGTVAGKDANGDYIYDYTFVATSVAELETIGVKKIGVEDFSGKIENLTLKVKSGESGSQTEQTVNNFEIQFRPVADQLLSMTVTKTFGEEYAWTAMNINANVKDTDGSETLQVQFKGVGTALDDTAIFRYSDGTIITSATFDSETWTISDIAYNKINDIEILYKEYNGNVDVVVKTVDTKDGITDTLSDANDSEGTFNLKIDASTNIITGAEDNTILYGSGKSIDAGAGIDTMILGNNIDIDFNSLGSDNSKDIINNIEKIDLSKSGDHSLTNLSLQDIIDITDNNNILEIIGDSSDTVNFKDLDKDWTNAGTDGNYDVYTKDSGGNTVTLKIDNDINTNII